MVKGSDQIGKRIVAFDIGEAFDKVEDVLFDYDTRRVLGFLVDEGGWFHDARIVPFSAVQSVGPDAVVVPSKNAASRQSDDHEKVRAVLGRSNVLKGTKIMTTDGRDLGTMVDLFFDELTGAVHGYEVSGGLFADAYSGRGYVPAQHTLNVGKEVAFVPPETALLMDEQLGGVKGALAAAGEKLHDASSAAGETLGHAGRAAADKLRDAAHAVTEVAQTSSEAAGDHARAAAERLSSAASSLTTAAGARAGEAGHLASQKLHDASQAIAEAAREHGGAAGDHARAAADRLSSAAVSLAAAATIDQARGRRVRQTVPGNGGTIVAPVGMIVTDEVIARARSNGREAELLDSVGMTPPEGLRSSTRETAGRSTTAVREASAHAAEGLKSGAARASETAGNLLRRTKNKLTAFQESRHEERINDALGRPVTRVILDREDRVILNVGELVTNEAVEAAGAADMLETMLDSVSHDEPKLTPEAYIAPASGQAALDDRQDRLTRDNPIPQDSQAERMRVRAQANDVYGLAPGQPAETGRADLNNDEHQDDRSERSQSRSGAHNG